MGLCDGNYPVLPAWVIALLLTPILSTQEMDVHVHVYRCCVDAENEEEMPEIMRERDFLGSEFLEGDWFRLNVFGFFFSLAHMPTGWKSDTNSADNLIDQDPF